MSVPSLLMFGGAVLTWVGLSFDDHVGLVVAFGAPGWMAFGAGAGIGLDRLWRRLG